MKKEHKYIDLLSSKLGLLSLNKYNIQLVDKFLNTPELNNSENFINHIDDFVNYIEDEHQAKVGKAILEKPELMENNCKR